MTGGSTSTWSEFDRYRQVGAHRARCCSSRPRRRAGSVRAGGVPRRERRRDRTGKRRARYGELADGGAKLAAADEREAEGAARTGSSSASRPAARHAGEDHRHARSSASTCSSPACSPRVVARPPVFGGDGEVVRRRRGEGRPRRRDVVQIASGVAVVAEHFWAAKLGRDALEVDWDLGPGAALDTDALRERVPRARGDAGRVGRAGRRRRRRARPTAQDARGRVRGAVPRARADGAAQLHRRASAATAARSGPARSSRRRPGGRGEDPGLKPEQVKIHTHVPRRRLRPARDTRRPTSSSRPCTSPRPPARR